jgi:hypothetical protein
MSPWYRLSGLTAAPLALLMVLASGCGEADPTHSTAPSLAVQRAEERTSKLLAFCPSSRPDFASGIIDADGGVLSAGSAVVLIPPDAVRNPTRFTLQPLRGRTLRVRITAEGHERFGFARPIAVMIGYAHCERQEFLRGAAVWHVDDRTNALLERMPTVNDSRNQTVGFLTTHLSTYAVAD